MNMIKDAVAWVLGLSEHYPDLFVLLLGSLVGFALTVALERYFLPVAQNPTTQRRQQGLTFLFCWFASGTASSLLWWVIDPIDRRAMRLTVSYLVGILVFFAYPPLVRYLCVKYPAIGTAWSKS